MNMLKDMVGFKVEYFTVIELILTVSENSLKMWKDKR